MAFFNSSRVAAGISSTTTIIAHGTAIKGDIQLKCHLHIDGEIEGKVQTIGNVVIGKSGVAKGDICAKNISISGQFEGSINGDSVRVLEGGKLFGKVTSKELIIESNAMFEGESKLNVEQTHTPESNPANAKPEKKENKLITV
jgi:cytoskeletal protein CcmA (bactofilin family)